MTKGLNKLLQSQLAEGVKELRLDLPEGAQGKLLDYLAMLVKWNKAYNLTAIRDEEEMLTHHFLDSLSIVPYIQGNTILDVGSGPGFPGIPCALALPDRKFTLLDSNGKKTRFLTQVVLELQLTNITVVQNRVENFDPPYCFETIVARAFSQIEEFIQLCAHLICQSGQILMMKGTYPQTELQNITNRVKVSELQVPGLHKKRHLVCIRVTNE